MMESNHLAALKECAETLKCYTETSHNDANMASHVRGMGFVLTVLLQLLIEQAATQK